MSSSAFFLLGISACAGGLAVYGLLWATQAHDAGENRWARLGAWIVTVALVFAAGTLWYLSVGQLRVIEDMHRVLGIG